MATPSAASFAPMSALTAWGWMHSWASSRPISRKDRNTGVQATSPPRRFRAHAISVRLVSSRYAASLSAIFSRSFASFSLRVRPQSVSSHTGLSDRAGRSGHTPSTRSCSPVRRTCLAASAFSIVRAKLLETVRPSKPSVPPSGSCSARNAGMVGTLGWPMRISSMPLPAN